MNLISIITFRHVLQFKIKCSQCGYKSEVNGVKCYMCSATFYARKELAKK